ncbi:MAG: rubredoxin-like domain-containing protein [Bacilli bacterium]
MKKYRCTICGYIYDESKKNVKFSDLPEDWKCPLCGAPKNLFEEIVEDNQTVEVTKETEVITEDNDLRELSNDEIAYICSNLAKACDKQYLEEEKGLYLELFEYFKSKDINNGSINNLVEMFNNDANLLNDAFNIVNNYDDSGAKRVLTWATKTNNIINSIIKNYSVKGIEYIKNNKIWVCDICGFVFIGDVPPQVCPICKVPNFKILEVE